ncbi:MAG: FAD-dependent oxidoreductase [Intestinimonas butyriciproducens]|uniref:FAD-dependent oxidoreductase n=1 Tax=Intestinimonas butyriciproducens TaxID=1297617 RepID=UPI00399166E8
MSHDIAVIGGGPAGLSAAINARVRNKTVLVVGNDYRESPLYRAERVDNYLGMPGLTGAQLLDAYQRHAEDMGVEFRHGRVLNIMPMEHTCYLSIGTDMEEAGRSFWPPASRGEEVPRRGGVSGPGRELLRDL